MTNRSVKRDYSASLPKRGFRDPLVPDDDEERFWAALDRDVERRALPVSVVLTQAAHSRNAGDAAARFGADVWGPA
jgi:hypothetical protein